MRVVGAGGRGLAGRLRPVQHTGLGIVTVRGGLAQCVSHCGQLVTVGGIGGRGGDLPCAAADSHLGVVAVGVIGEVGYHALRTGGRLHIVVAVIGVGLTCAGGQRAGDVGVLLSTLASSILRTSQC